MKLHEHHMATFALAVRQTLSRPRASGMELPAWFQSIGFRLPQRLLMIRHLCALLFLCASFLCATSNCFAQDRGTVTGTVTDPNGAPVPNAKITARNTATGLIQEATTSDDGTYSVVYLPAGSYTVTAEAANFKKSESEAVRVSVNTTVRIDVGLQLGSVQETVEVSAAAPLLQTDRTDLGKVVDSKTILDLPLFIGGGLRDNLAFVNLIPGVQGDVGNPRIGGGLLAGASLLLDGAESNSERRNDAGFQAISTEAVEEFKVQTGTYSAEYGRTSNGIINFTHKSGTNELHGSAFYFNRNEAFNARRFTYGPGTREISRQHLGGGTAGGPIYIPKLYDGRNKAFWFFSYERSQSRGGNPSGVITLPIPEFRRGDFRRYTDAQGNVVPLYDPLDASGNIIRDAFARPRLQCNGVLNVLCPERISPLARTILNELPLPDDPTQVFNNTRQVGNPGADQNVWSIKGDYNFSERSRVSGLFSRQQFSSPAAIGPVPGLLGENFNSGGTNKYYRVNYDYTFTPNLLSHFTFGHNRRDIFENGPQRVSPELQAALQIPGATGSSNGTPTGYSTEFGNYGFSVETVSPGRTWNLNEQITWVKGRHNIKFGFQYLKANYRRIDCNFCAGQVGFSAAGTGNPGIDGRTGSNYASFLLGLASGGNFNYGADIEFVFPYYAGYVQDDFKVSNKLTLNLGLRYDLSFSKRESQFQNSNFNPNIPNPAAGGRLGAIEFAGQGEGRSGKDRLQDTRYNGFGPRLGIAYQVTPTFVVRGGGAMTYQAMREDGNADNGVLGFGGNFGAPGSFLASGISFRVQDGFNTFADLVERQRPPRVDPTLALYGSPTYMTPEAGRAPYFVDWNLTLENSFTSNTVARVSYHANVGVRLLNNKQNFNQLDPRYWDIYGSLLERRLDDPLVIATGFQLPYPGYPTNRQLQQALRPYPQYGGLGTGTGGENSGHFTYHALESSFEHRFNNGLYFLGSYTFSKLLTNVEGENPSLGGFVGEAAGAQQNQYNRAADKSVSNQDTPHNLVLSYIYELPVGRGKQFLGDMHPVANALIGNWRIAGVQRYQSGRPLRVVSGQNLFGAGGQPRASYVPGQPLKNPNFDAQTPNKPNNPYINPAAFRRPANREYGDTPALIPQLRGTPLLQEDISLLKNFYISEGRYFELRGSAFNIFNRHRLGGIDQNLDSPTFGRINNPQINNPREIQFAFRFIF